MTSKRKLLVYSLATIAFIALFLLPVIGFMATETGAAATAESAVSNGDYVFFVIQNDDVPLAAAPSVNMSAYILWVALGALAITILFIYSTWYFSMRQNVRELAYKLSPAERRSINVPYSFFHPVKCYRLVKETEDNVASLYLNI